MLRTHTCGELKKSLAGERVTLTGWINSLRNHGGLIFLDLRDRYGLTQIKVDPVQSPDLVEITNGLRQECVIKMTGTVIARPQEMINSKMETGEIEVLAEAIETLSQAKIMPFEINEEKAAEASEALRLKYRFLDLRRPKLQKMLATKDAFITYAREYFHKQGFMEIQTPILANSSPEGARDFLIPSRVYPGKFYALPQAPQQFKQLLMVAGLDKYFQIAPCFRDEDPRMDRHYGEFYQLDMEMSFVEQDDVFAVMQPFMKEAITKFSEKEIINLDEKGDFKRLSWTEAMDTYGIDKPDLRFEMKILDVSEAVKGCGFPVFEEALNNKGVVKALKIEGGAKFTRKEIDEFVELAKRKGGKGLAYLSIKEKVVGASFAKFLSPEKLAELAATCKAVDNDLVFFAADSWRTACSVLE